MVLYVGVDIVEIDRVAALRERYGERFKRRVFSEEEWDGGTRSAASLAARFAGKEAAIKALSDRTIAYHEVEVVRATDQPPRLRLRGRAEARARQLEVRDMAVSLSHSRECAVAMVVMRSDDAPVERADD